MFQQRPDINHDGEVIERELFIGRISDAPQGQGVVLYICDKYYEIHKAILYLSENLGMYIDDILALSTEDFLKLKDGINQSDLDKVVA